MGADEMIVSSPPLDMQEQMLGVLSQRPGLAHQGSDTPADGQIDTLNESGLNERSKVILRQERIEIFAFAPLHSHDSKSQLPTFSLLDKLAIVNRISNVPLEPYQFHTP